MADSPASIAPVLSQSNRATPERFESRRLLSAIAQSVHAQSLGAVIAAKELSAGFESVTDDSDAAGCAVGCERLNRALETVIGMALPVFDHLECLVVVIAAG